MKQETIPALIALTTGLGLLIFAAANFVSGNYFFFMANLFLAFSLIFVAEIIFNLK